MIVMGNNIWDYDLDKLIDPKSLKDVKKFHQSTTLANRMNSVKPINDKLLEWLKKAEYSQSLPNIYEYEVMLTEGTEIKNESKRKYSKRPLNKEEISIIMSNAFSFNKGYDHKKYPSAGGLYTITPVLCVLDKNNDFLECGSYVYDSKRNSLKKINTFSNCDLKEIVNILPPLPNKEVISNYFIAYAIDIKKAIAKYKKRGYRYSLIEIGLMAQTLRNTLDNFNDELGELCWAGFDDNALSSLIGLNVSDFPVGLIQWFGK